MTCLTATLPENAQRADGSAIGPRHAVAAVAVACAAIVVTSNAWRDLIGIGLQDEESSHVWLVPLVFAALVWVRRHRLADCAPERGWLGTAFIGLGWMAWSLGYRHQVQSLWHGGAVAMAVGGLLLVLGQDVFARFLPAFASLIFLVPVPGRARFYIAAPLQSATAAATQGVADVLGIKMERFGSLLTVNGNDVAVAEACNGMRMVFTLLLACYLFAFITPLRTWVRLTILVLSPLVAVVCNVGRLVPTVYLYGHASADVAEVFHDVSGWVMLILAFMGLTATAGILRWAGIPVDATRDAKHVRTES